MKEHKARDVGTNNGHMGGNIIEIHGIYYLKNCLAKTKQNCALRSFMDRCSACIEGVPEIDLNRPIIYCGKENSKKKA